MLKVLYCSRAFQFNSIQSLGIVFEYVIIVEVSFLLFIRHLSDHNHGQMSDKEEEGDLDYDDVFEDDS